jgi:phage-related protein
MGAGAKTIKVKFDGDSTGLASATEGASATLERFNKGTEETRKGMDRVGEGSENLADSSSLATGALGALASGFELVGLDGYAESLQKASLATDFMSGVGDSLTLVTQKLGLAKARDAVNTIRQSIATKASTAATKAATVAQRAMNLVLRANPVGIVITAIIALVAVFVLAYKKSETFRRIVNGALNGVKRAASAVVSWIKKYFPPLFQIMTTPYRLAWSAISKVFGWIKTGAGKVKTWITGKFNDLVGFFRNMPSRISGIAGRLWDGIGASFRAMLNSIIRLWNNFHLSIDIPDKIPGLPGSITINTPNVGYLATGGYAQSGRTYVVGENGPELLTMGGRGFVTPNGQLSSSSSLSRSELGRLAAQLMELLSELMRGEINSSNRQTRRRALAGAGANR